MPVETPTELQVDYEPWSFEGLRQLALERQPEIAAAQLNAHATTWGIEVAALRRRPDVAFSFGWQFIDDNRPPSNVVNVGQDAWSLGSTVTVPLWHEKNSAIHDEAVRRHYASHAATEELVNRYEQRLLELLAEAASAAETASLYKDTMLGQADQTLQTDRSSYSQGRVEFDRVIDDARALLNLQVDYHRALGRLAETIAQLELAVASSLTPAAEAGPF
jgi:outer membrane protein TolC